MKYRTYEVYTQSPTDFKHVLTINAGSIAGRWAARKVDNSKLF